jgi:hypothetical protein
MDVRLSMEEAKKMGLTEEVKQGDYVELDTEVVSIGQEIVLKITAVEKGDPNEEKNEAQPKSDNMMAQAIYNGK